MFIYSKRCRREFDMLYEWCIPLAHAPWNHFQEYPLEIDGATQHVRNKPKFPIKYSPLLKDVAMDIISDMTAI